MIIFAIILGCLLGFAFAYMVTGILVAKSNNHGDSKGNFTDFAQYPLNVTCRKDNLRSPNY